MPNLHRSLSLAAAAALLLAGCGEGTPSGSPPVSSSSPPPKKTETKTTAVVNQGPPHLKFAENEHDFGTFPETETRTARVGFTNDGGSPLLIREVKTTCGCTTARLSKTSFAPGESGELEVTMAPTAPGPQRRYVRVIANTPEEVTSLVVTADVQTFLRIEPRIVQFGRRALGSPYSMDVHVSCPDEEFTIQGLKTSNPVYRTVFASSPTAPGVKEIRVELPSNAPWGGNYGQLEITARGRPTPDAEPVTHTSTIRLAAELFGQLVAEPNAFRFGGVPGIPIERHVTLQRSSGEPFTLTLDRLKPGSLRDAEVRIESVSPGVYELILTGQTLGVSARYSGSVALTTDVPGEEQITIPIVGAMRPR